MLKIARPIYVKKKKTAPQKGRRLFFLFYADNIPLSGDLIFSSITLVLKNLTKNIKPQH